MRSPSQSVKLVGPRYGLSGPRSLEWLIDTPGSGDPGCQRSTRHPVSASVGGARRVRAPERTAELMVAELAVAELMGRRGRTAPAALVRSGFDRIL